MADGMHRQGRVPSKPRGSWWGRLLNEADDGWWNLRWRWLEATPTGQFRLVSSGLLLVFGVSLVAVLIFPQYDRALVLSGRTEVLSMRLDDVAFGELQFETAVFRPDPDTPAAQGRLRLDIQPGANIRFARIGRGDVRMTFAAGPDAPGGEGCSAGLRRIGAAVLAGLAGPLCDAATVVVPLRPTDDPLVIGLSGGIVVGEEVSQGAGPRPLLLEATASLLVKHGSWFFRGVCRWDVLENLCDRFVANSVVLSPGDAVRANGHSARDNSPAGLGFIRIDPSELQSGMLFNLAAPATAFEVQRMQGETFTVRESLFDVVEKSPVVRTLNTVLLILGLLYYFLRLPGRAGGHGAALWAVLLSGTVLGACWPAHAQQALLRAEETGQALLRSRGDRCYAITPSHVLGTETSALVTAPGRERGEGDVLRRVPAAPEPVALLVLRGVPLGLCPAFEGAVALDDTLRAHSNAVLQLVRSDGSIDRIPLLLGAVEVETLEVRSADGRMQQGMSGGTVLVADRPVGLLVDVMEGGQVGRVARLDRIFERLSPHLSSAPPVVARVIPVGSVPYEIVRSSAAPVDPSNKATSLQGDGPGPWRVSGAWAELVLKVAEPFGGIVLDLKGLPDPPQTVEVLGGRSERGPWQSLASMSLELGDGVQARRFPANGLSFVLIRAYASQDRPTLAVKRISFSLR